jgi:hypothetical protein
LTPAEILEIINLAGVGINSLLKVIGNLRGQSGMSDDQIMALFEAHSPETKAAIQGYLDALPAS